MDKMTKYFKMLKNEYGIFSTISVVGISDKQHTLQMAKLVKVGTQKGIYRYAPVNEELDIQTGYIGYLVYEIYKATVSEHSYFRIIISNTETGESESFKGVMQVSGANYANSIRVFGEITLSSKVMQSTTPGAEVDKLKVQAFFNDKTETIEGNVVYQRYSYFDQALESQFKIMNDVIHDKMIDLIFYRNITGWQNMRTSAENILSYCASLPINCSSVLEAASEELEGIILRFSETRFLSQNIMQTIMPLKPV